MNPLYLIAGGIALLAMLIDKDKEKQKKVIEQKPAKKKKAKPKPPPEQVHQIVDPLPTPKPANNEPATVVDSGVSDSAAKSVDD